MPPTTLPFVKTATEPADGNPASVTALATNGTTLTATRP